MPIYEFFCSDCNTVFNFFSRTVNTTREPYCPKCQKNQLKKMVSAFSVSSGKETESEGEENVPFDETKMEKAMKMLEQEASHINEDNPKEAASFLRKFTEASGAPLGPGMKEALARMEAGEDPEKIEQEMGELLEGEGEELFAEKKTTKSIGKFTKIQYDENLYELT